MYMKEIVMIRKKRRSVSNGLSIRFSLYILKNLADLAVRNT